MPETPEILKKAWDFKEVDWNDYESHRPPYTQACYDIIFQHHQTHSGNWDTALDVGAGGGTVSKVLLEKFKHVILTDASEQYIERAKVRFAKEAEAGRMSFIQRRFEEFETSPDVGPVDLITAGTCIHFSQPTHLTSQLAPRLRPGGTFAAFAYGSTPIFPPDDPAGPIVKRCKDKIMRWIHETILPIDATEAAGTAQARYDNIAFDPALWSDVRRIRSMPNELAWPEWIKPAPSRVKEGETKEVVGDELIEMELGYEFFPGYFYNFAPGLDCLGQIKEELEALKEVMGG